MPRKKTTTPPPVKASAVYLTTAQLTERGIAAPGVLKNWRCLCSQGPYWVDLANPGRNQQTPHVPAVKKPMIRYPLDQLEAWLSGVAC